MFSYVTTQTEFYCFCVYLVLHEHTHFISFQVMADEFHGIYHTMSPEIYHPLPFLPLQLQHHTRRHTMNNESEFNWWEKSTWKFSRTDKLLHTLVDLITDYITSTLFSRHFSHSVKMLCIECSAKFTHSLSQYQLIYSLPTSNTAAIIHCEQFGKMYRIQYV